MREGGKGHPLLYLPLYFLHLLLSSDDLGENDIRQVRTAELSVDYLTSRADIHPFIGPKKEKKKRVHCGFNSSEHT